MRNIPNHIQSRVKQYHNHGAIECSCRRFHSLPLHSDIHFVPFSCHNLVPGVRFFHVHVLSAGRFAAKTHPLLPKLSRSELHASQRRCVGPAYAIGSQLRSFSWSTPRQDDNVHTQTFPAGFECTTFSRQGQSIGRWAGNHRSNSCYTCSRSFLSSVSCRTVQGSASRGSCLGKRGTLRDIQRGVAHSRDSVCLDSAFGTGLLIGVHWYRRFVTMAAFAEDTGYKQLADDALSYVRSQHLGAYIDGHWIAHDADPSRFPQRLLQLLQHSHRTHPHEYMSDRQHKRQQQTRHPQHSTAPQLAEDVVPVSALSLTSFEVKDPATGDPVCLLPALDTSYVRAAIAAAARAQRTVWGPQQAPPARRHHVLQEWERLVKEEKEHLASVLVLETGKPLPEGRGEILYAASYIEWFAEQLRRDNGILIPSPSGAQALMAAYRQPVGVCALITPWNMPAAMLTRKAAAALAAGCCCVCKLPAEAPLTALCLGRLAERAGIPAGVLNLVTTDHKGSRAFADEVCRHAAVRKLSFTGSTRVGKLLMQQAALTMKRVSLELGGNAPFIVFEDADIDEAVQALLACKFRNAGQTCVCANRVYVHRDIWDAFVPQLVKLVRDLIVGHGFVHGVSIGPLITKNAREKVERLLAQAVALGARLLYPVDALASGSDRKDSHGGGAAASRAAEQLLHAVRGSLPEHLRSNEDSHFFPPVVVDCRAFDGLELEALRGVIRKDVQATPAADTSAAERQVKRESSSFLQQLSSRFDYSHQEDEVRAHQEKQEEEYPEILQAEIFGPVLPLYSFSDEADVIKRANATKAGLAAYVCTRDLYRISRVTAAIEAGLVGVNTGIISTAEAPFGGIKESGMGREGSVYGLDEYTELKYICVGGGAASK